MVPPAPWTKEYVGAVGSPGSALYQSGTFTVNGAGADVWNTADAFHYVYQPMDGDGTLVARVTGFENVYPWSKSGVMIRNTLDASAPYVQVAPASSAKGTSFQFRTAAGAPADGRTQAPAPRRSG